MTFKAFKIWYSDKQVVGYTKEDWDNAPSDDVQVVVIFYEEEASPGVPYSDAYMGMDEYSFNGKKVYVKEYSPNSAFYKKRLYGTKKLGKYVSNKNYQEIMQAAVLDNADELYDRKVAAPPKEEKHDGGAEMIAENAIWRAA